MKQTKLIFAAIATCLLFSSADAFAQRSRGGSETSSRPATSSVSASPSSSSSTSKGSSSSARVERSSRPTHQVTPPKAPNRVERGPVSTSSPSKHLQPHKVAPAANYHKQPHYGSSVSMKKATRKSHVIKHHTGDYYYRDGIFYRYHNNKYVIHRPHAGFRVSSIPEYRVVWVNGVSYYYYYGTFYSYMAPSREYVVVAPPVGAIVESIPDGYERIDINGNTYYTVGGVQYKAVIFNGEIWYEVIKVDNDY
ncbi:MAG: hypothetical protein J6Y11_00595 [Paludibacteraceae bacterium]|nr:hypothetical protein [Paludibacteraceae bacterium]